MKIAFVLNSFPEISQTFITVQIIELLKCGHEITIFSQNISKTKNEVLEPVKEYGLLDITKFALEIPHDKTYRRNKAIVLIAKKLLSHPVLTVKALSILLREKFDYQNLFFFLSFGRQDFDIIHCHFGPAGNIGLFMKRTGIFTGKLVTTFHGYDVSSYIKQKNRDIYKELFNKGDCFTYNSEATKKKLLLLGCPPSRMYKLPMGIPVQDFEFKPRSIKPNDQINVLSVGRLVEMKGRKYAIEAIAELHKKYPKLQYYIVGDGPCRAELEAQVEKANLTSAIHFTGWVSTEKLKSLYDKAHIFLHPSITASDGNQEGQGMVLIEAQAQGIPVIATRHNAFTETILDGITGLLAEEKTVEELVEKMDIVIRNPQTTASIIQNAKKRVDEFYNSEKLNNDLIHIYERL